MILYNKTRNKAINELQIKFDEYKKETDLRIRQLECDHRDGWKYTKFYNIHRKVCKSCGKTHDYMGQITWLEEKTKQEEEEIKKQKDLIKGLKQ